MRVAVVGAGVSGLAAAHELARKSSAGDNVRVTVYEEADYLGGHARTVAVDDAGGTVSLDLGSMHGIQQGTRV
jgi:cyclopropane-fatty-acyl-phospholipid synthase